MGDEAQEHVRKGAGSMWDFTQDSTENALYGFLLNLGEDELKETEVESAKCGLFQAYRSGRAWSEHCHVTVRTEQSRS